MNEAIQSREQVDAQIVSLQKEVSSLLEFLLTNIPEGQKLTPPQYELIGLLSEARGDQPAFPGRHVQEILIGISTKVARLRSHRENLRPDQHQYLVLLTNTINRSVMHFGLEEVAETPKNPTRRRFLQLMAGVVAGGVGRHFVRQANGLLPRGEATSSPEINELLTFIQDTYGLDIYNGPPFLSVRFIQGKKMDNEVLLLALKGLKRVLQKYPKEYFRNTRSTQVVLLEEFRDLGSSQGGMMISMPLMECIYINVLNGSGLSPDTFHHEAYHNADFTENLFFHDDQKWREFQQCECRVYDRNQESERPEWFVSPYAETNPVEDRAEMAERVMDPADHVAFLKELEDLKMSDPPRAAVRQRKYDEIIADYGRFSQGKMAGQYWEDLRNDKIGEDYFP